MNTRRPTHPPAPASTSDAREHEQADPIDHPFDDLLRACSIGAALAGSHPLDQPTDDVITAIRADAGAPRAPVRRDRPDTATHPGALSAGHDADPAAQAWEIVQRVQAGDIEAFGLIHQLYADTVFRFVYFRVGNRQLAEDLTSETFLRALKRIGGFTWQGQDLGAWLVTIARDLVADHFRSGHYRLETTTGETSVFGIRDRTIGNNPQ